MSHLFRRALLALAVACGAYLLPVDAAEAAGVVYPSQHHHLFYNYYQAGPGVHARMYLSPLPTPPIAGRTHITYPPLMPHEFLYRHSRVYYRYYPASLNGTGAFTRTRVVWH